MPHQYLRTCTDKRVAYCVACPHYAISYLTEKDAPTLSTCTRLDLNCADIYGAAVGLMARGSTQINAICELYAGIHRACIAGCAKHSYEHCQKCMRACGEYADACRVVY